MQYRKFGAAEAVAKLDGWSVVQGREAIAKRYQFADFSAAFGFMTRVALYSEKLDHHPEWSNVYNRIDVLLRTHDVDGVTDVDITLANFMDRIAAV